MGIFAELNIAGRFFLGKRAYFIIAGLLLVEFFLFFSLVPFNDFVYAQNISEVVLTTLTVGNVYPEVINVSIQNGAATVDLIANNTKMIACVGIVRDYNGDGDIANVSSAFYASGSNYGDGDDNNTHYSILLCTLNKSYGDQYEAIALCNYTVPYYANNATWNCTVKVTDNQTWYALGSDDITINPLLALDLPSNINYGTVNATVISEENVTRVDNVGNVGFNLSLYGYAVYNGDNLSMNCSLGTLKNISIGFEKYNLTASNPGFFPALSNFDENYTNLTGSAITKLFDLHQRQNDTDNEAFNQTYWRIYVPLGVAGTCSGNIVFVATQGNETG